MAAAGIHQISQYMNLLAATGSFTVCSLGMMLFNKLAVRSFPLAVSLVATQMSFTVIVMATVCYHTLRIGSLKDVIRWSAVIPFFVGLLVTSMFALQSAPMSLVITFRALSPFLTLFVERFFPNPTNPGPRSLGSMILMVVAVGLYTKDMSKNVNSSYAAIGWVTLNSMFACAERLLQRLRLSKDQSPVDISKTGVTLLNNLIGAVPLLGVAWCLHEPSQYKTVIAKMHVIDYLWLFLSCLVGVGISFSAIWAQSLISATSMLILTLFNKFILILLELFVMPDKANLTIVQVVGAILTIVSTVAYAMAREAEDAERNAKDRTSESTVLVNKNI